MSYIECTQIENTIITLARRAGFDGDPYTPMPLLGPLQLELAAEAIVLDAGVYDNQPQQKQFARQLARAVVFSSTRFQGVAS